MLIDHKSKSVSLLEFPGKAIIVVPVRSWEHDPDMHFPWATDPLHGEEGVWYRRDDLDQEMVRLKSMGVNVEDRIRHLYELRPVPQARRHCLHHHRWVVRYWDTDVYTPTIMAFHVTIIEHYQDNGPIWEYVGPAGKIYGIPLEITSATSP